MDKIQTSRPEKHVKFKINFSLFLKKFVFNFAENPQNELKYQTKLAKNHQKLQSAE